MDNETQIPDDDSRSILSTQSGPSILSDLFFSSHHPLQTWHAVIQPNMEALTPPQAYNIRYPGTQDVPPKYVADLKGVLSIDLGIGFIPQIFKDRIYEASPHEIDEVSDAAFAEHLDFPIKASDTLWSQIHDIVVRAVRCHEKQMDEHEWIDISRAVLQAAGFSAIHGMLEVINVQSQQIDPTYLAPNPHSSVSFAKKADLAIAFAESNSEIRLALEPLWKTYPEGSISHLTDVYTSSIPLVCGIEVKQTSGDANEAVGQLAVWCSAALRKMKALGGEGLAMDKMFPFLGWTVIGHDWRLYISWLDVEGGIVVLEPWNVLDARTSNFQETFKLLRLLRRTVKWLQEEYWPWYRRSILHQDNIL